jgi:two-component system heavy metal sensor histidine kinase CusS
MRRLVVEDELKTATYLKKGLSESGFSVQVAQDGDQGLFMAMEKAFDLIILDVMLPRRSGWSLLETLRQNGQLTPVLFLTARDTVPDRVKGLELGADDYLVKPFAFSELLARPQVWLRVLDGTTITIESRGIAEALPVSGFGGKEQTRFHGRRFLLHEQPVGHYLVQGALETTVDEGLVLSYRHRLFYALLLGSSACTVFGWWAANRGLSPIRTMVDSTRTITAHRLQERLEPADAPQELRDLVQALNDMLNRLEQAFSRLSQFSADLAHELRTPITNLTGEAEVALSRERPGEEYRRVLESSLEEFRRLSQLITRMLFLARVEDPQTAIKRGVVEPQRLVDEVLAFFEALAEEQGVRLECSAGGRLRGDADLLRQALANLVANALQATPRGGRIQVTVQSGPQGAEVLVRDTGRGIPAAELPYVCDRFARTRASLDGKAMGTGLGLAIVHSIVRLHGGTLRIESEQSRGTTVRVLLPD